MIPIEGKPADVVKVVESYAAWLANADGFSSMQFQVRF
jgi:hypothetical protein